MSKPNKVVPTNRVSYERQKDALKAFAYLSEGGTRAVSNVDVSRAVSVHDSTIRYTNNFFEGIKLLTERDGGYLPSQEVIAYQLADEHGDQRAFTQLAPRLRRTWFADVILPKVKINDISVDEAIQALSIASSAGKEYRGRLQNILNYLEDSGLITIDGNTVKAGPESYQNNGGAKTEEAVHRPKEPVRVLETVAKTTLENAASKDGISLSFSIKVDTKEIATWPPERITAFFGGLAQVLSAKGKLEED